MDIVRLRPNLPLYLASTLSDENTCPKGIVIPYVNPTANRTNNIYVIVLTKDR